MSERIANQDVNKGLMDGLMKSEFYLKKSGLDLKLIELMKYRVSQLNGCAYCLDMHHKEAIQMGETELRIHSLAAWKECPFYSEQERAVFAFAEALTLASQKDITDDIYHNLEKHFTRAEIADLTLAVTQINSWNRINKVFRPIPGNYVPGQYV
jgi:AhpD family alkylhydroperoxidase